MRRKIIHADSQQHEDCTWLEAARQKMDVLKFLFISDRNMLLARCHDKEGTLSTVVLLLNEDTGRHVPLFKLIDADNIDELEMTECGCDECHRQQTKVTP